MQILGMPYDSAKFHTTANHKNGSCSFWNSNNIMRAKVATKEMAAVKFSVFSKVERGQGNYLRLQLSLSAISHLILCLFSDYFSFFFFLSDSLVCSCVLPLSSITTGYQHIYLSEDIQFTSPPPSLFIHATVRELEQFFFFFATLNFYSRISLHTYS